MIEVVFADLTQQPVDAVVNAANAGLYAGAGVCGAIHTAGGPQVLQECMALPGIQVDADNPPSLDEFQRLIEAGGSTSEESSFRGAFQDRESFFMRCPTGDVRSTTAGNMPSRYVIHAVGPIWTDGASGEPEALDSVHRRIVEEAHRLGCSSVALPAISTGIFGFPLDLAAKIAVQSLQEATEQYPMHVQICVIDERTGATFQEALAAFSS